MIPALWPLLLASLAGQEAESGFEVNTTLTAGAFYSQRLEGRGRASGAVDAGYRAIFYPVWKINSRWAVSAVVQTSSRPFFFEQFETGGRGATGQLLQAHLSYSRYWKNNAVVLRFGQLSSAFGAFNLRYDDARNPLIDMPSAYGYYYPNVTVLGLPGAQADVTLGKLDLRGQFVNSSPANRRSVFDSEQYGSWAAGAGYSIRQGLRVGYSTYQGAYLHRKHRFYRAGEADPRTLNGSGHGIDVQWGRGAWNVEGEWQRFLREYRAMPDVEVKAGYGEVRRVLHPRLFLAARIGYLRGSAFPGWNTYDVGAGVRVNARQLVKVAYQFRRGPAIRGSRGDTLALQFVTTLPAFSLAAR